MSAPQAAAEEAASSQSPSLAPMPLTPSERLVLAALSRRPRGLLGSGSVTVASGVPESETRAVLTRLEERGLVTSEEETIRWRDTQRRQTVWMLRVDAAWFEVAAQARTAALPELDPEPMPNRLPDRFAPLFWWGDPSAIELPRDAAFVAEHLLACDDIAAWGWAVTTLPRDALERVAAKDFTPPETKAMIRNALARRP
ncbi:MAG: hypothetical protein OXC06_07815 [Acidimicrobiaceae bacterium]|nr:hypothetical protein [Acidimicrobiaceae bacterium]